MNNPRIWYTLRMRYFISVLAFALLSPTVAFAKVTPSAGFYTPTAAETTILALIVGSVAGLLYVVFAGQPDA